MLLPQQSQCSSGSAAHRSKQEIPFIGFEPVFIFVSETPFDRKMHALLSVWFNRWV